MRTRSLEPEIMDQPHPPAEIARKFHRDLLLIHALMGTRRKIGERLADEPGLERVIDIGCGDGALLASIRDELGVRDVIGIDLKPPDCVVPAIPVLALDATRDALPDCDVALCAMMLHHLTDGEVIALIRNVGRSAKRFVCLDLVRHPLPLALYTLFICPLLSRVGAVDGRQSIRRAFTGPELRALAEQATEGADVQIEHWVSRVYARQVLDIRWTR